MLTEYHYLASLEKFGINLALERITFLLEKLGNPHLKFQSIHVAGTNGKGSTCALIASILKEAGYKVGLYTSPHLFDYTERIKINGREIPKLDFVHGLTKVKMAMRKPPRFIGAACRSTVFEVLSAVAFWYFAKETVDYAVVEVGLGGRLDATNVITPLVSIITNIDYEHTAVLGKTLAKIAYEKSGIIKPGVPVVTAETKGEPLQVMKRICEERGNWLVGVRKSAVESRTLSAGTLIGKHQQTNAACAIAAIRLAGIRVSRRAIRDGLKKVKWPARFQIISKKPLVIVDGAHNPAGAQVLRETIEETFPRQKFTLIFGCQKDKDKTEMLRRLKPVVSNVIITHSSNKNAAAASALDLREAIKLWDGKSPRLIAGSLYLIGEAIRALVLTHFSPRSKITATWPKKI